ncbi:MAG: AEC family transporter [Weeksellaceae bacterium]
MNNPLLSVLPVILTFLTGYLLKRLNVFKKDDGDLLLKLVFYVGGPAIIFQSLVSVKLNADLLVYPLTGAIIMISSFIFASLFEHSFKLPKASRGVFMIASMIVNTGFTLPFLLSTFGEIGVVRYSLFGLVADTLVVSWVYAIACQHNPANQSHKTIISKLFKSPPVWATVLGLMCNLLQLTPPDVVLAFAKNVGSIVGPLIMLSLGLYFQPKIVRIAPTVGAILIRMLLGTTVAILITAFMGVTGVDRKILILLAASPVGFNTITYSSLENLDKELAASIVSISILIGLVLTPILLLFL